jgi:transposase
VYPTTQLLLGVDGVSLNMRVLEKIIMEIVSQLHAPTALFPILIGWEARMITMGVPHHTIIKRRLKLLDWPGNSPDLNPIENMWVIFKARISEMDCTTKTKMTESVVKLLYHDPEMKEMCGNLVVERVKEIIKAKWGHIHY